MFKLRGRDLCRHHRGHRVQLVRCGDLRGVLGCKRVRQLCGGQVLGANGVYGHYRLFQLRRRDLLRRRGLAMRGMPGWHLRVRCKHFRVRLVRGGNLRNFRRPDDLHCLRGRHLFDYDRRVGLRPVLILPGG